MEFEKIFDTMPHGGNATGRNFEKVKQLITFHDWDDSGIVMLNGAKLRADVRNGYTYAQFEGFKLVSLSIQFVNAKSVNDYVQIPISIAPNENIMHVTQNLNGEQSSGMYIGKNGIITVLSPVKNGTEYSLYVCTVTYVRKDD